MLAEICLDWESDMTCSKMSEREEIEAENGSESESSDAGLAYHVTFAHAARNTPHMELQMQPISDSDQELKLRRRAPSGIFQLFSPPYPSLNSIPI